MRLESRIRIVRLARCGCILLLAGIICGQALAQSGRSRPAPPQPTATEPQAQAKPANDSQLSQPSRPTKINLTAAKYVTAANVAFETGVAFRSFVARLEEARFLIVSAREDVRRKEAIDLAKHSENVYVAWLQVELDLMGSADARTDNEKATITPVNPGCLYVTYAVYEAGTGRAIAQGHTYQRGYQDRCAGTVYHPSPYPDRQPPDSRGTVPELELKRAGSEAADRVLASLDIAAPK